MTLITSYDDSSHYLVDDNFSYTTSAPGFHTRTNKYNIKDLPIWLNDTNMYLINKRIILYPTSYQVTKVEGNVYFKNSTIPVGNISVININDKDSPVYADLNGFYSIDIYHDGWLFEELTTTENIFNHNAYIVPDTSKWGKISGRVYMDPAKTEPLQGASVTVGEFSPVTDQYGNYELYYLKNTDLIITISAFGYETVTEDKMVMQIFLKTIA